MDKAELYSDVAEAPEGGNAYYVKAKDGVRLRVAAWSKGEKGTVLMFPGRTEYIEKYGRTAKSLARHGFAMATIDWRGQGLADRLLTDRALGHVGTYRDYQLDVAALVRAGEVLRLPLPWFLLTHSMGGAIGLRALHEGLPVKAAAFSAPMWGIGLKAPLRPLAWTLGFIGDRTPLGAMIAPGTRRKPYTSVTAFQGNLLTTDADSYAYMDAQTTRHPDLALGGPTIHWTYQSMLETRALRAKTPPDTPSITFLGENERVVDPAAIHQVMGRWKNGTLRVVPKAEHEILMERPELREGAIAQVAAFFAGFR